MRLRHHNYRWLRTVLLCLACTGCVGCDSKAQEQDSDVATAKLRVLSESLGIADMGTLRGLIARGADVNVQNKYGATTLMMAAEKGYTDIVRALIEAKADVTAARDADGVTPILIASQEGHAEIVNLLIEYGVNRTDRYRLPFTGITLNVSMEVPSGILGHYVSGKSPEVIAFDTPVKPTGNVRSLLIDDISVPLASHDLVAGMIETREFGQIELLLMGVNAEINQSIRLMASYETIGELIRWLNKRPYAPSTRLAADTKKCSKAATFEGLYTISTVTRSRPFSLVLEYMMRQKDPNFSARELKGEQKQAFLEYSRGKVTASTFDLTKEELQAAYRGMICDVMHGLRDVHCFTDEEVDLILPIVTADAFDVGDATEANILDFVNQSIAMLSKSSVDSKRQDYIRDSLLSALNQINANCRRLESVIETSLNRELSGVGPKPSSLTIIAEDCVSPESGFWAKWTHPLPEGDGVVMEGNRFLRKTGVWAGLRVADSVPIVFNGEDQVFAVESLTIDGVIRGEPAADANDGSSGSQ